ncbi:MAG TPA: DUF1894 domain-containing protein [Methanosarcinales archaeon]|nr:DUF1894 domain-containing protein [Methanosarcinales archaeon]
MGCIEEMDYEIILRNTSFKECREFVEKNFKEIYHVKPGYKMFDVYLIGVPPITIGVDGDHVVFPYVKPCHGTFLLRIRGEDEIASLKGGEGI